MDWTGSLHAKWNIQIKKDRSYIFIYAGLIFLIPPPLPIPPHTQAFIHVKLEKGLFVGERGTKEGNGEQI